MKRFHIALGVRELELSVAEYTARLGLPPCLVIPGEYALWRTEQLNFSIRCTTDHCGLRHLGWEDSEV